MVRSRVAHILRFSLVLFGVLALPADLWAAGKPGTFYVPINRSELLTTAVDMGEVIIADPQVADVYVHGKNKVSVIGKQIGQTTLRVFDGKSRLIRSVDVYVVYDLPAIRKAMREFLPYERIGVEMVNTRIALTGEVTSAEAAATAVEIAEQFVTGTLSTRDALIRPVIDSEQGKSPILNLMKISAGQQVMLRIRIGEIQRTALRNLGVNLQAVNTGSLSFAVATGLGQAAPVAGSTGESAFQLGRFSNPTDSFGQGSVVSTSGSTDVAAMVDALERDGLFKTLAEPNLVALSGEQAQFLAGGEFPIPVPQDQDTITVEYKPFGVSLKFTPYVLSQNRIRVQVNPEVSEVSPERSFTTREGYTAPSLITRRASTTVELAPGEAFMIAGLLRDNMLSTLEQLPGASEVPVLSALFRSTAYQRNETELVIAVTPYIVNPLSSGDIKLPTDDFRPATFMESVFFGALGAPADDTPSAEGPIGFLVD
ncbi:MAG: type II and III secretion system protein family protein [Alphaproteobacteria bacterium]